MSFRHRDWEARVTHLGDQAEGVFEEVYEQGFVRFGLNRPPLRMGLLPPFLRYTPDYLTSKGLVEVQGFGRDQTSKFKVEKLEALHQWHEMFRVDFFVFDSLLKRYGWVRLPELQGHLGKHGRLRTFPEGKSYWALPAFVLPVIEWVPYGEKLGTER